MMSVVRFPQLCRWAVPSCFPAICILTSTFLFAGCSGAPDAETGPDTAAAEATSRTEMDHTDMDHSGHDMGDLAASGGEGYTEADVRFMQMMIGHHDQAVQMAALSEPRDAGPDIRQLSERIDISQRDEIFFMQEWLRQRDQPVPEDRHLRVMEMPGLVSEENFERLTEARGPEFDRLFLELMIEHHLGAIQMVDNLFDNPLAAQESDIFRFATDVAADQLDEIHVMERLLADL